MAAALLLAVALAGIGPGATEARYERPEVGLSVEVPLGWEVVRRPLSRCTNPAQRLALRGRGALVQLVETLDYAYVHRFPPRPRRFALRGRPEYLACCPPRQGRGWFLTFRDGNRGFHAYVYPGADGARADALRILDSLRVRPRGAK